MLIGGMFDVDVEKAMHPAQLCEFPLRCDTEGNYRRKKLTNNGRTATTYVFQNALKIRKGDKVLAPEYMCVSVVNAFEAAGVEFGVYRVKEGLVIDLDDLKSKINDHMGAIYVIHYFGFPQPAEVAEELKRLSAEKGIPIIEDLTQSLLTRDAGLIGYGDYLVSSVRKWFPITDGGIAAARNGTTWADVPLNSAYDEAVYTQMFLSLARKEYAQKELLEDKSYLELEKLANSKRYLDFAPREMTEISRNILFQCDVEEAADKRRANYQYLYQNLQAVDGLTCFGQELDDEGKYVPFGFQVLVENREDLYQYLRRHKIIGEIQWILPVQYYKPSDYAAYLSEHSLMLQCDQRYGEKEMAYVIAVIQNYFA